MTMQRPMEFTVENLEAQFSAFTKLLSRRTEVDCAENLKKLNDYYRARFINAKSDKIKAEISIEYAFLLATAEDIHAGNSTAEDGIAAVKQLASNRKLEITLGNIFKAAELLFWLGAATTSYAFCMGLGIPMLFLNPPFGVMLTAGTCALAIVSCTQAYRCVGEFNSYTEVNEQQTREKTAMSFFSQPVIIPSAGYQKLDEHSGYNIDNDCAGYSMVY